MKRRDLIQHVDRLTGSLVTLVGAVALLGWWADHAALAQRLPGIAGMTFNTALGFVLIGVPLLLADTMRRRPALQMILAGCIVALALSTLLQDLTGFELGVDNLFFSQSEAYSGSPHPGRMSPNSALAFLLIATALWLPGRNFSAVRAVVAQGLLLLTITVAIAVLGMKILFPDVPVGLTYFSSMSSVTALGFLLASVGLLFRYNRYTFDQTGNRHRLFFPALHWLQRLSFLQKFMLLSLLFLVPLGWALLKISADANRQILQIDKELIGLEYIQGLVPLFEAIPQHRGLRNAERYGSRLSKMTAAQQQTAVTRLISGMNALDRRLGSALQTSEQWRQIAQAWARIVSEIGNQTPEQSWVQHTELVARLISLMRYLLEYSGILIDAHSKTQYLLSDILLEMPSEIEYLAQARGLGAEVVASRYLSGERRFTLSSLAGQIRERFAETRGTFERLLAIEVTLPSDWSVLLEAEVASLQFFLPLLENKIIKVDRINIQPLDYFAAGTSAIASSFGLFHFALQQFERLLKMQSEQLYNKQYQSRFATILLLILVVYLLFAFYLGVMRIVQDIESSAKSLLDADKKSLADAVESKDELEQAAGSVHRIASVLMSTRESLSAVIEFAIDGIISMEETGKVRYINPAAEKIFGYTAEEVVGHNVQMLMPASYQAAHAAGLARYLQTGESHILGKRVEVEGRRKDGSVFPLDLSVNTMLVRDQRLFLCMARDITEHKQERAELERLAAAVKQTTDAIVITDPDGSIVFVNPAFERLNGYRQEEVLGGNLRILNSGQQNQEYYQHLWQTICSGKVWKGEHANRRKDGSLYDVEETIVPILTAQGEIAHFLGVQHDISERKEAEKKLAWLSYYDELTELPNRRLFSDRTDQAIVVASRENNHLSLLYIDLDRFKFINDSMGHALGDLVLQEAALRIQQTLRVSDTVARLGGDEFAVLLPGTDAKEALRVANKLRTSLLHPYRLKEQEFTMDSSIGIAIYPADGKQQETLLRHADTAMSHAKQHRVHIHYFSADMEKQATYWLRMEQDLIKATEKQQFALYYQAKHRLGDTAVIGMEALIRWSHPERGFVSPAEFIPVAEETGLIQPITRWVLAEACRQAIAWDQQGLRSGRIGVNLSAVQLMQTGLAEEIIQQIHQAGAKPEWIEVEITETAAMRDPEIAITIMHQLVEAGISVAIDDFGTGYSSLAYLKRLPAEWLKIDIAFIRNLPEDQEDAAIVRSTIAMAHALGMKTIAEGVETQAQLAFLKAEGCHAVQGYLFSKPLPAVAASAYIKSEFGVEG